MKKEMIRKALQIYEYITGKKQESELKKDYRQQTKSNEQELGHELKTDVLEVKPGYWTGRIHQADGSIVNVKVNSIEYLLDQCDATKSR